MSSFPNPTFQKPLVTVEAGFVIIYPCLFLLVQKYHSATFDLSMFSCELKLNGRKGYLLTPVLHMSAVVSAGERREVDTGQSLTNCLDKQVCIIEVTVQLPVLLQ